MSARKPAFRGPVYEVSLKDWEGFPTVVVAGPDREHLWLYVHDTAPTVLRLHRWVVRFLLDALREVIAWFDRPEDQRRAMVWVLPKQTLSPECALIATDRRVWMHVFAVSPSVVRLNERTVEFLLSALVELPAHETTNCHRWTGQPIGIHLAHLNQAAESMP